METYTESIARYEYFKRQGLDINMERGWPCKRQLDLSMPMLDTVTSRTDLVQEVDYRGYDGTGGIMPLKRLFADILNVMEEEIYIGGTMSTTLMFDIVNKAFLWGFEGNRPWKTCEKVKFICPSPGYEKHFKICTAFGIEMIPVTMDEYGPDMDAIEKLAVSDDTIKGIWCVPLYSNPTGAIYSDEVVFRLASMKTAAEDFRLFWDNAYCVHHLTETKYKIRNIIRECEKAGNPDRVFEFASTSKITFPGGGVAVCASSIRNIQWMTKNSLLQLKSGDKINQLRHVLFLRDREGLDEHMARHRSIIAEKFDIVDSVLKEELEGTDIVKWEKPKGGYFFNVKTKPHLAKAVCEKCIEAGVRITPAGSTFPYGNDPEDAYLRLAPTFPDNDELEKAMRVFCLSAKIAAGTGG